MAASTGEGKAMDSSARKRRGAGRDGIAARAMAPEQTGSARRWARHGGRTRGVERADSAWANGFRQIAGRELGQARCVILTRRVSARGGTRHRPADALRARRDLSLVSQLRRVAGSARGNS